MKSSSCKIPLPADWSKQVRSAILQVISLASMALTAARSRRYSLRSELDRARQEIALLKQELELRDLRMARAPARHRPYYQPAERLAILELRAARGWSLRQTARRFHLQPATVAEWMKRIDDEGESALLKTTEPVNRLPDFVRYLVKRFKALYQNWFNHSRPPQGLDGRTPSEVYDGKPLEPPEPIKVERDKPLIVAVSFCDTRRCLPVVTIKRAA